jgi:parallel beta-helix repeat protein
MGSSNISLDGVDITSQTNGSFGSSIVHVGGNSRGIRIENSEISGLEDDVYYGHYGIHVEGSASDVVVQNNYIHDMRVGIYLQGADNIIVAENRLEFLASDSMKIAGSNDLLIENNIGARYYYPKAGEHLDFIQFQGSDSSDVVVRGNISLPANRTDVQGIFFDDAHYSSILIEQNIIVTGMIRGVSVSSGTNVVARQNTVLNIEGGGSKATKIMVDGESFGNIEGSYLQDAGPEGDDMVLQQADASRPYYYGSTFSNATAGLGITLEDLRPVPGGYAESYGASTRLAELLGETTSDPIPNRPPIARDDSISIEAGASVTIDPSSNDSDPDGDAISVGGVGEPENGSANLNTDGTVTYTPDSGYSGVDTFDYDLRDAEGGLATATVTVDVISMSTVVEPDPPSETTNIIGYENLGTHDFNGAKGDVIVVDHSPALELASGTILLKFNADTVSGHLGLLSKDASKWVGGGNHFTSYILDGSLHVRFQDESGSESFSMAGLNPNQDYEFQAAFGDGKVAVWVDGELLGSAQFNMDWRDNSQVMQVGANGWASPSGGSYFTHIFDGTISDIQISEGSESPPIGNTPPIAKDDEVSTDKSVSVSFDPTENDIDPDGDAIGLAYVGQPGHGSANLNADGSVTYTPDEGFTGSDSFDYVLADAFRATTTASISVEVSDPIIEPEASFGMGFSLPGVYAFSGSDRDVIVVEHSPALELASGKISFIFNADTISGHQGLLSKDASYYEGGGHHFAAYVLDGALNVRFQDEDKDQVFELDGITADRDYAFQAEFGDGKVAVWLDGQIIGVAEFGMDWRNNVQDMQVGANGWSSASEVPNFDFAFDGTIADVLII